MTPTVVLWVTIALTGAVSFVAVLRRCFRETRRGVLRRCFADWNVPEDFDEREKLERVAVVLLLAFQTLRAVWVVFLFYLCFSHRAFGTAFLPPPATEAELQALAGLFVPRLVATGVVLVSVALLFFELLPQVVAGFRGSAIATRSLRPLCTLESALSPLTGSFRGIRRALLRMVGNGEEQTEAEAAEENIRAAVEIGEREGVLLEGEKSMIESLLKFHDADVAQVMTPRTEMTCLEASRPVADVVPEAIACGHSRIPVYRGNIDSIVGILYVKDLLRYTSAGKVHEPIENAIRQANFVPETKQLSELLAEFRTDRFHIAIILDEYGGTAGLVTIEDILEEIVGEIEDEYDPAQLDKIRPVGEEKVTFDLDGRAHIDEVSEAIGVKLPESDDYETVAGLIFCRLGKVPKEGDEVDVDNLRFKITAADERKIKRIRLHVLTPQSQDLD